MVRDKLLVVGVAVDEEELLHITLKGLPKDFNAFRSAIRIRSTKLSFDELSTMLNAKEESLNEGLDAKDSIFAMVATATPKPSGNFNQFNRERGRGNSNNRGRRGGRGVGNHSPQYNPFTPFQPYQSNTSSLAPRSKRPTCQICGKLAHIAIDCYHKMDYAYQGKHSPTKLVAMATASNACLAQEQPWLADSAATDHVTANLDQLNFPQPYGGQDHLIVGNGQNLPITHIGKTVIPSSYSTLNLNNVPRVPSISSNLAFIHKICHDNHCWYYFDENILSI